MDQAGVLTWNAWVVCGVVAPADLEYFQKQYNLQVQPIAKLIGPNDPSACAQDPNNCVEATLDSTSDP